MKLLKYSVLLILICIQYNSVNLQRCGDHLWLSLINGNGEPIKPSDYQSIKISTKAFDIHDRTKVYNTIIEAEHKRISGGLEVLSIRTECGLIEAKFDLQYKNDKMEIIIKNIPGDAGNFILNNFQFRKGKYEVNLGTRLENCVLVHDTIVEGNKIIEEKLWRIDNNKIFNNSE